MERQEIIENLDYYINSENTDYAIMIDGEWGIGKSFFIKNDLYEKIEELNKEIEKYNSEMDKQNKKDKKKKYRIVYVSLFGVSSVDEVDDEIIFAVGPEVTKKVLKTGKGLLNENAYWKQVLYSGQEYISDWLFKDNVIIIFDDLERIKMDVVTLLGHLNKYVEHNKSKVIFIANQKELLKLNLSVNKEQKVIAAMNTPEYIDFLNNNKDKGKDTSNYIDKMSKVLNDSLTNLFVNEDLYNLAKEKVIGKTLKFEMNFNDILNDIIRQLKEDTKELKIIDDESIEYISEIAEEQNHYNIRTFKRILENCLYYFKMIEKLSKDNDDFNNIKNDEKYKNEIFKQFVVATISYKKNIVKYDKMVRNAKYEEIEKERVDKYRKFYNGEYEGYKVFESVKEIVENGSFKEELVKEEYYTYLEHNKNIGSWRDVLGIRTKYANWFYLTESELSCEIEKSLAELKDGDFRELSTFYLLEYIIRFQETLEIDYENYIVEITELLQANKVKMDSYIYTKENYIMNEMADGSKKKIEEKVLEKLKNIRKTIVKTSNVYNEKEEINNCNYGKILKNIYLGSKKSIDEVIRKYYLNGKLENYIVEGNNEDLSCFAEFIGRHKSIIDKNRLNEMAEIIENIDTSNMDRIKKYNFAKLKEVVKEI